MGEGEWGGNMGEGEVECDRWVRGRLSVGGSVGEGKGECGGSMGEGRLSVMGTSFPLRHSCKCRR